jgi:hypothetical protein
MRAGTLGMSLEQTVHGLFRAHKGRKKKAPGAGTVVELLLVQVASSLKIYTRIRTRYSRQSCHRSLIYGSHQTKQWIHSAPLDLVKP